VKTRAFSFRLPVELIAQEPPAQRGASRLLVLDRGADALRHARIAELPSLLSPGTVMVLNDSRVRKARLFGSSTQTGGAIEALLLERLEGGRWRALTARSRSRRGRPYLFPGGVQGTVVESSGDSCVMEFEPPVDEDYLERHGHVPLPPYIRRQDTPADGSRYQTVYARHIGSAAAPTAGLHLSEELLADLGLRGVQVLPVTLHVGLGTFLPIRSQSIEAHVMHTESYSVPPETAQAVNRALAEGRKVLAVGTTAVRTLESAWREGELRPGEGQTALYILPGYRFRVVSQLLTNFHTPQSTLLVMVSAFAGRLAILRAYREAVRERYRFFSYGDAMLIL
jgi:S-adenosylmethionine:tRNA ribosyltransferase-isomerase